MQTFRGSTKVAGWLMFLICCFALLISMISCGVTASTKQAALALTDVKVAATTTNTATLAWTTNMPSTSQVDYGTSTSYGSSSTLDTKLVTTHSVVLTGLAAGTSYHARAKSGLSTSREDGMSGDVTFITGTGLAISNVAATAVSTTSATITWSTSAPATSQIEYGTTAAYGSSSALDTNLITSHSQSLTGLTPGTLYYLRVISQSSFGTFSSLDTTFTTPTSLAISAVNAVAISANSASIVWTTNIASTSQVEYGQTNTYGTSTALDSTLVNSHAQLLTGLNPSTAYHYRVSSSDSSGNNTKSGDLIFTTAASTTTGLPTGVGWHQLPNTKMQGNCPTPDNPDSITLVEGCKGVIADWSGGVADTKRNRLIIWGGGHAGYGGNELYSLNLASQPPRMELLNAPTTPGVGQCTNFATSATSCIEEIPPASPYGVCSDGGGGWPNARHTYAGLEYLPTTDTMFAWGGSLACGPGNGSFDTWLLDFAKLEALTVNPWTHMNKQTGTGLNLPGRLGGGWAAGSAVWDPNTQLLWLFDGNTLFTYDQSSNTYTRKTPTDTLLGDNAQHGVVDPAHKLFLMFGLANPDANTGFRSGLIKAFNIASGNTNFVMLDLLPFANSACGNPVPDATGQTTGIYRYGVGLAFDPVWNVVVIWPNLGPNVYLYNADPSTAVSTPLGSVPARGCLALDATVLGTIQDALPGADLSGGSSNGAFGRFRYFPTYDAFAMCNNYYVDCYILRLR